MNKKFFLAVLSGTIATILASVILSSTISDFLASSARDVWEIVVSAGFLLVGKHALPGWLWLILFFFAAIGLLAIVRKFSSSPLSPGFLKYRSDCIHGIKWRWQWIGNQISNLWGYCPKCDATLVYEEDFDVYSGAQIPQVSFHCENCNGRKIGTVKGHNRNYALGVIEREILRRIRTNEYGIDPQQEK